MQNDKKITIILLIITVLFASSSCETKINNINNTAEDKKVILGEADYKKYESIEDMANSSDYIILGIVLDVHYEWRSLEIGKDKVKELVNPEDEWKDGLDIVTVYEIQVVDDYTSSYNKGDIVNVIVLGGETDKVSVKYIDEPILNKGCEYLLFLAKDLMWEDNAWLKNNKQAIYELTDDNILEADSGFNISIQWLEDYKAS